MGILPVYSTVGVLKIAVRVYTQRVWNKIIIFLGVGGYKVALVVAILTLSAVRLQGYGTADSMIAHLPVVPAT